MSEGRMLHALPRLPYAFDSLEPHLNASTLRMHYRGHHLRYVRALNRALADSPEWQAKSAEELCRQLDEVPESIRAGVRESAGGHWNHTRMWSWLTPHATGAPFGRAADAIVSAFGTTAAFTRAFSEMAVELTGCSWIWLVRDRGMLRMVTSCNQDNPLMQGVTPVLGLDMWEHAYCLQYRDQRAQYVRAWWHVVNWSEVNRTLKHAERSASALAT